MLSGNCRHNFRDERSRGGILAGRLIFPGMKKPSSYAPPFAISPRVLDLVARIGEQTGRLEAQPVAPAPHLRRGNRIRTIQASLAIEQNTLNLEQMTALLDGKRIKGTTREIQEVRNAYAAYELLDAWSPSRKADLLKAHGVLMKGLVNKPGSYRSGSVGVTQGERAIHIAPPALRVPALMDDLLGWLATQPVHPLVASCVFHYELEFIHPFLDGNGRLGRLWQTLILSRWNHLFGWLPIETAVRRRQADYYSVLGECDKAGTSTAFVEFMLGAIESFLGELPQTDQVTDQVKELLRVLGQEELGATELRRRLGLSHPPTFRQNYLDPALRAGRIVRTDPGSPRSPRQRYRARPG